MCHMQPTEQIDPELMSAYENATRAMLEHHPDEVMFGEIVDGVVKPYRNHRPANAS